MDNAESIVEYYFKFLDRDGSGITSAQPTFTVNTRSQAFTSKLLLVFSWSALPVYSIHDQHILTISKPICARMC